MKIEKISENQIRCTLDRNDLLDRHLKVSELAYGSEKANALFKDMIQQASAECDFVADDIPLMIEAIPVSADCLVLLITKVTDPDELDSRFSNFTASSNAPAPAEVSGGFDDKAYADEIISCFEHLSNILGEQLSSKLLGSTTDVETLPAEASTPDTAADNRPNPLHNISKVYSFDSLQEVINLSKTIRKFYHGANTLYKDPSNSKFYLVINLSEHTAEEFNKVCNIISEYGRTEKVTGAGYQHFEEHYKVIARNNAVKILSKM